MIRPRKINRVYHHRSAIKVILFALCVIVLIISIFSALIFFGFQRYAVYTEDGVTLEVPWLEEYRHPESADTTYYTLFI